MFRGKAKLNKHQCNNKAKQLDDMFQSFICETCGRALKSAGNLKDHRETHLIADKRRCFECYLCKKDDFLKRACKRHMQSHITSIKKSFCCETCQAIFTSKSSLNRHHLVHTDQYPHLCRFCGKSFRDRGSVKVRTGIKEKNNNNIKNIY